MTIKMNVKKLKILIVDIWVLLFLFQKFSVLTVLIAKNIDSERCPPKSSSLYSADRNFVRQFFILR